MTRLAILSDIHGHLPALEAVIADLARFSLDDVIVAGDVVNWGPMSAQVLERVTADGWPVIRGNNEFYLLDYETPRAPAAWQDRAHWPLLPWLKRQLAGYWEKRIAAWPDQLSLRYPDAPPLLVVHGRPGNPWVGIHPSTPDDEVARALQGVEETTVVAAHTHLPLDRYVGRWHLLNPGSVGVPLDGADQSSYLLLEGNADGWHGTLRRIPIDHSAVLAEFERQGFVEECGVVGHLVVEEFRSGQLELLPFILWRNAVCPDAPLTMDLLNQYTSVDKQDYTPAPYHLKGGIG